MIARWVAVAWVAAGTMAAPALAAVPAGAQLLGVEDSGRVQVDDERALEISGVTGTIEIASGDEGAFSFVCTEPGSGDRPLPLALWLSEGTFYLTLPEGQQAAPRALHVEVPARIATRVVASDTVISASGAAGGLDLRGTSLDLRLEGLSGELAADLSAGRISVKHAVRDVTVKGSQVQGDVTQIEGRLTLALAASTIEAHTIASLDADLEDTRTTIAGAGDRVVVRGHGGKLVLRDLDGSVDLTLRGTTADLSSSRGEVTADTDAELTFRETTGAMHVTSSGASIRGNKHGGALDILGTGGAVLLDEVSGPTRIQVQNLTAGITGAGGELTIHAVSAPIKLERAGGPVTIQSDGGGVSIVGVSGDLDLTSNGGDVHATELAGAVKAAVDAEELEVGWSAISRPASIRNEGGDVVVRLPGSGAYRLEVATENGRIQSDLDWVVPAEDGRQAVASRGGAREPLVRIDASGDISLTGQRVVESAPEQP